MPEVAITHEEDRRRIMEGMHFLLSYVTEEFDISLRHDLPQTSSEILRHSIEKDHRVALYRGTRIEDRAEDELLRGVIGSPATHVYIEPPSEREGEGLRRGRTFYYLSNAISLVSTAGVKKLEIHSVYNLRDLSEYKIICALTENADKKFLDLVGLLSQHIRDRVERTRQAENAEFEIKELEELNPKVKRYKQLLALRRQAEEEKVKLSEESSNLSILANIVIESQK